MTNELLTIALDAHGGLDRWSQLSTIRADLSITGAVWYAKQKPDVFAAVRFAAETRQQVVTLSPVAGTGRTRFADDVLVLEDGDGVELERRPHPEGSYAGQTLQSPWDDLHAAYFATEAIWTYLTTPFLFTYPGFVSREVAPRSEDGEVWRGLEVDFPDSVHSHSRTQTFYFGPDGLLRRHDYTVDILGGATGANYASDIADVDGIKVPLMRRIWAYDEHHEKVPDPLLVAVDVLALTLV